MKSAASSCDQPMRGIYGAVTICARPAGHTGKHDPIWNHKDWPEASSAAKTGWACGFYLCPHQPKCEFRKPTDDQPAASKWDGGASRTGNPVTGRFRLVQKEREKFYRWMEKQGWRRVSA